jgi:hypothetical protein
MNKYSTDSTSSSSTHSKIKVNGYSSVVLHAKRDRKRIDAEARQREYDSLSLSDKIARIKARPNDSGESKRELSRLQAKYSQAEWETAMNATKKIQSTPVPVVAPVAEKKTKAKTPRKTAVKAKTKAKTPRKTAVKAKAPRKTKTTSES